MKPAAFSIHTRTEPDLDFTIVAEVGEAHVGYKLYDVTGWDGDDYSVPWYGDSKELASAPLYLHGDVKWDGCSNWWFDEQEDRNVMLHGCSRADIERLGKAMALCWDWTKELIDMWEGAE